MKPVLVPGGGGGQLRLARCTSTGCRPVAGTVSARGCDTGARRPVHSHPGPVGTFSTGRVPVGVHRELTLPPTLPARFTVNAADLCGCPISSHSALVGARTFLALLMVQRGRVLDPGSSCPPGRVGVRAGGLSSCMTSGRGTCRPGVVQGARSRGLHHSAQQPRSHSFGNDVDAQIHVGGPGAPSSSP